MRRSICFRVVAEKLWPRLRRTAPYGCSTQRQQLGSAFAVGSLQAIPSSTKLSLLYQQRRRQNLYLCWMPRNRTFVGSPVFPTIQPHIAPTCRCACSSARWISIAFHQGLLYRMNGFDGQTEQGGSLDVYDSTSNTWSSQQYLADGVLGPCPRSVSAILPLAVGDKP
jgi:hypothetical protein